MPHAVDRVVFSTECVTIGAFRCAADHPSFRNSGPIRDDCFVFPRTAVIIQHENARAFVADPTIVTLYNRRQQYERRAVSADGDRCDWFAVSPDLLRGAVRGSRSGGGRRRAADPLHACAAPMRRPISRSVGCSSTRPMPPTPIRSDVEERVVALLDRVLTLAYADRQPPRRARPAPRRLPPTLADAAKALGGAARVAAPDADAHRAGDRLLGVSPLPIVPARDRPDAARVSRRGAAAPRARAARAAASAI